MDDEIDLTRAFLNLWEGKIKIISSALIALLIAFVFNFFSPKPNFEATTEIKPLSSFQSQPYNLFNSYGRTSKFGRCYKGGYFFSYSKN